MTEEFYNNDQNQRLLSASISYLNERTKELYDKSWLYRYYNELSWVYGVTEEEIINFKALYESTLTELRKKPQLEDMPLTNEKVRITLESFPKFDEEQFLLSNYGTTVLRGFFAYILFPYAFYLIYKNIKKTQHFRHLLSDILVNSKTIVDTLNTDNIEGWLELQKQKK